MILGITGGSGCGTTTVGLMLREKGFCFIDADAVYHELLEHDESLRIRLTVRFGHGILSDGKINRRALAAIVFSDEDALADLNTITHGVIVEEIARRLRELNGRNAAVEAIALFESGLAELCDASVSVLCDREVRIRRITARDSITEVEAASRVDAQKDDSYFIDNSDYILLNNGTEAELRSALEHLLTALEGNREDNKQEETENV